MVNEIPMEGQTDRRSAIAKHVIDGSTKVASIEEFEMLIELFPNNPALHRAFSDFLARKKKFSAAADGYGKASQLFIESGMLLKAIVSKALQWRIIKPSKQDLWAFYSALHKERFQKSPLYRFFSRLSFPELAAIIASFKLLHIPANKVIRKLGTVENSINFIVSGTLRQTTFPPIDMEEEIQRKSVVQLTEGDFFGEIYPFEAENLSQSVVKSVTRVELTHIPKEQMIAVCKKYHNVEFGLIDLYDVRSESGEKEFSKMMQRSYRQDVSMTMKIDVYPDETGRSPVALSGFSSDISMGGVCVVLDPLYEGVFLTNMIGRRAKVKIILPNEAITMSILGTIVWAKSVSLKKRNTKALGIQFKEMPPKLSGLLVAFANIVSDI